MLQPVPSREQVAASTRMLAVGETIEPEQFVRWLVERGFARVAAIELPGEFSMHGGILDLFPQTETDPLRIEFFGDESNRSAALTRIRNAKSKICRKSGLRCWRCLRMQMREEAREEASAASARSANEELLLSQQGAHVVEWLPPGSWIVFVELPEMLDEGRHYLGRLDNPRGFYGVEATFKRCIDFPTVTIAAISGESAETVCHLKTESVERFDVPAAEVIGELAKVVGRDEQVLIACHNSGESTRLSELLSETDLPRTGRVVLCEGHVLHGFRLVSDRLIVLSDHELFGRRDIRRTGPKTRKALVESRAIDSFLELSEGHLVVHLTKGIARYRGMQMLGEGDRKEEHLVLEFRDGVKLFVPASLIHLVQKYVGGAKSTPTLSKIGSNSWEHKKQAVAEALADLAGDMVTLQAARAAQNRESPIPPTATGWPNSRRRFPIRRRPTSLPRSRPSRTTWQTARPMDRLICGDVGYGKTEVAIRAAFKAVDAGKQVAVLVPTTILAEQHHRSFSARMAEYPVRRSRSCQPVPPAKRADARVLKRLAAGNVDILIGTHRLVQKDVAFQDLGLVVIDEEQRFGVEDKEWLKTLGSTVDVLTLSATPIPRTLHMSLLGIRDISNLETPPPDRKAIETRIMPIRRRDDQAGDPPRAQPRRPDLLRPQPGLRHPETIADRIQSIVPEARIGIGHGQMGGEALERTMLGLHPPASSTSWSRPRSSRAGSTSPTPTRSSSTRPTSTAWPTCTSSAAGWDGTSTGLLLSAARRRAEPSRRTPPSGSRRSRSSPRWAPASRSPCATWKSAAPATSWAPSSRGHIATVGYELYCQLLENAVRRLKNQPVRENRHVAVDLPLTAYLPGSYVPPGGGIKSTCMQVFAR